MHQTLFDDHAAAASAAAMNQAIYALDLPFAMIFPNYAATTCILRD